MASAGVRSDAMCDMADDSAASGLSRCWTDDADGGSSEGKGDSGERSFHGSESFGTVVFGVSGVNNLLSDAVAERYKRSEKVLVGDTSISRPAVEPTQPLHLALKEDDLWRARFREEGTGLRGKTLLDS